MNRNGNFQRCLIVVLIVVSFAETTLARGRSAHSFKQSGAKNVRVVDQSTERPFNLCNSIDSNSIVGLNKPLFKKDSLFEIPQQPLSEKVDYVLVDKTKRRLYALRKTGDGYEVLKTYGVGIGQLFGPKLVEGDKRTPEGIYQLTEDHPSSHYHRSIAINYPNAYDRLAFNRLQPRPKSLGGNVMIHGTGNGGNIDLQTPRQTSAWGVAPSDWSIGCISLTNEEVDELASHLSYPATVEICPDKHRKTDPEQFSLEYGASNSGARSWHPNFPSTQFASTEEGSQ